MFDWLNTNTEQENETQRGQAPFGSCFEECQRSLAKDSSEAVQWVEMGRWFFFTSVVLTPDSHPQGNYVLDRDELVEAQKPEYDVVLCLSLTKWVHLNWGDEGLKRMFRRIYRHLRPGGILVLEPQPWSSYGRRKTLTVSGGFCRNWGSLSFS